MVRSRSPAHGGSRASLPNPQPELAVALGAAYYGVVRLGQGVRVGSGSPRAFYVAVDTADADKQRRRNRASAWCRAARKKALTSELDRAGVRGADQSGGDVSDCLPRARGWATGWAMWCSSSRDEVTALAADPQRAALRPRRGQQHSGAPRSATDRGRHARAMVPRARQRPSLAAAVRPQARSRNRAAQPSAPQATIDRGRHRAGTGTHPVDLCGQAMRRRSTRPRRCALSLEQILGLARDKWPTRTIRQLARRCWSARPAVRARPSTKSAGSICWAFACGRAMATSATKLQHADSSGSCTCRDWQFPKEPQNRSEWWVLWRRVAGGLSNGRQQHMFAQVWPYLEGGKPGKQKPNPMFPKKPAAGRRSRDLDDAGEL